MVLIRGIHLQSEVSVDVTQLVFVLVKAVGFCALFHNFVVRVL